MINHLLGEGYLGWFQVLTIIDKATASVGVNFHVSGLQTKYAVAGPYGHLCLVFRGNAELCLYLLAHNRDSILGFPWFVKLLV